MTVLDVGGNPAIWSLLNAAATPKVIYLNMPRAAEAEDDRSHLVFADGRRLPFPDQSFDLVFSNSVIEHVGNEASQQAFASEIARVGKCYWVQTPNFWFPVEQHLMTPLLHWLPRAWQRVVAPRATIWALLTRCNQQERQFYIQHFLEDIRLLDKAGVEKLFPDATIQRERVLGFTKSLIALKLQ